MRALPLAALALTVLAAAPIASAQDDARARQLFELGVSSMDRGQYAQAEQHFQSSFQLSPRASTACNMAVAQERLGRPCDARAWYQQCATLDRTGDYRDRAIAQGAALASSCQTPPPRDPFVRAPASGNVQIVEGGVPTAPPARSPDHTLLGLGIGALALGIGALVGGVLAMEAAHDEADQIRDQEGGVLREGTPDAEHYHRASTLSAAGTGLYVGAGVLAALGATMIAIDLAQPGVFGPTAAARERPRLALRPREGGASAELRIAF